MSISLYIHVPFCSKICPYCDFTTVATKEVPEDEYCSALIHELTLRAKDPLFSNRKVRTLFWGGGTPSLLSGKNLERVHSAVGELFGFSDGTIEITLEANPNDISKGKAADIAEAGINRVSIGSQSSNERILKLLGRNHSAEDITKAVSALKTVGIKNINLDLIFGAPEQDLKELEEDIKFYTDLSPTHISTYGLTIERGTPFFQAVEDGVYTPVSPETERELYLTILQTLPTHEFNQYEVSNFAKDGYRCAHNLHYWKKSDYLGIGVGAHSYSSRNMNRWANTKSLLEYNKKLLQEELPVAWKEELKREEEIHESLLLGLRLKEGIEYQSFVAELTSSQKTSLVAHLEELSTESLIEWNTEELSLTENGLCIADTIIESLISVLNK